jgi:hypothetical protein
MCSEGLAVHVKQHETQLQELLTLSENMSFPQFYVGFSCRLTGTANPIGAHEFPRFVVGFRVV